MRRGKIWLALLLVVALCGNLLGCYVVGSGGETLGNAKTTEADNGNGTTNADNGSDSPSKDDSGQSGTGTTNTGNLTEEGNGYEGIAGTGNYNYGEALQKSLLFYELQRSGDLPEEVRCNWRGDSGLTDGSDVGLDLTGGWYDAGDNMKFNLPMAYSAAVIGWSVYENKEAYEESGQLAYALADIRWVADYLIKCHPEDEVFYYQVGNGSSDHSWWGPCEVMSMERPSYCVTKDSPGSCVVAQAAAALCITSILFAQSDADYATLCLLHAKSLFDFANETRSDAGYTAANGFYTSNSGYFDELSWAATWLYLATEDTDYLTLAKDCYKQACQDYNWALCWDDVHIGTAVLLAGITEEDTYKNAVETHLDYWTTGTSSGERISYTPKGLAWLDSWGSLRYATTTAFVAATYSEYAVCDPAKKATYWDFAVSQADYALGSTGRSFMIGFGENPPVNPHHRTAQGSYCNNMNEPAEARHTLYGALVGGPDANDGYNDVVSDFARNEVACDYNAGFTGLLAALYAQYHGETLKDFGAVEEIDINEIYVDAGINVDGTDFVELKLYVYNVSAWPARKADNAEVRYFIDLSEIYEAGKTAADVEITTNYVQSGRVDGLRAWNEEDHIYYLSILFDDGNLYPGGQEHYKQEIQVRLKSKIGIWDNSNDYSFEGLGKSGMILGSKLAVYDGETLIFGSEPDGGSAGELVDPSEGGNSNNDNGSGNGNNSGNSGSVQGGSVSEGDLTVSAKYDGTGASASSISGTVEITTKSAIDLTKFAVELYFNEGTTDLAFDCYHSAISDTNNSYLALSGVNGIYASSDADKADTCLTIGIGDKVVLAADGKLTINFSIHKSDWSAMNTSDDYFLKEVGNIVLTYEGKVVFGKRP